jgi:hypothetical protein
MKKQMKFMVSLLFLLLVPLFLSHAQPQSFYISSGGGQTIKDFDVQRIYCLEYSKDVLRASNLAELTKITGNVRVTYNNGRSRTVSLNELLKSRAIDLIPFDSYEFLRFIFLDKDIKEIEIMAGGISLFREMMTAKEEALARANIAKIIELEKQGKSHAEIQRTIWRTRTGDWIIEQDKLRVYDFMTTTAEGEKIRSSFDRTATVSYEKEGKMFLRLDGLLAKNANVNKQIIELITHYHNDHITSAEVEQAISEGSFERLIAPYPALAESRNRVFNSIAEQAGVREYDFRQEHRFLEITNENIPFSRTFNTAVGDFNYSSFRINEDMTIEMYKYRQPRDGQVNHDGLIYQFTHKNVSYLLWGDFDDINGIENLINASAENEKQYFIKSEAMSNLQIQGLKASNEVTMLLVYKEYLEQVIQMPGDSPEIIALKEQIPEAMKELNAHIEEQERTMAELAAEIESLNEDMKRLPFLKADVMKWPHHAHVFDDNERADSIIRKLLDVVDPQFIVWQTHSAQDAEEFMEYIKRFERLGFRGKFICSDGEMEIEFLSLLDLLNARGAS